MDVIAEIDAAHGSDPAASVSEVEKVTGYSFSTREALPLALKLGLLGLTLGVIAVALSPLLAAMAGCVALWGALVLSVRKLHTEQDIKAAEIAAIRREYGSIVSAMASAIGLKDGKTHGHAHQISDLALVIAQQMQVSPEEVQVMQRAAVLADVGKIELSQSILSKEGDLTEDEWEEMRRHPELGSRILADVLHMSDAGEIVLAHHERFDGKGYPRGLKGEQIPLGARIFAVADSYVAMTSQRPHRKSMSHRQALREILRSSMTQFDPDVVRAFVSATEAGLIGSGSDSPDDDGSLSDLLPESKLPANKVAEIRLP
jgi:DNA-binding transcriptional regulator YiaG